MITVLRELWDRRRLVLVAALVALTVGFLLAYRPGFPPERQHYTVGLAATDILVDTPSSRVVSLGSADDGGQESGELAARASLLANLIAANPLRGQIAARAGIDPRKLVAVPPVPDVGAPALATAPVSPPGGAGANVLTLRVDTTLPIISVIAQAPTTGMAARLSNGAVEVLKNHLGSVAVAQKVPEARKLVVKQLGAARTASVTRGPRRLFALLAAVVVFTLACAMVVIIPRLARGWREVTAEDRGTGSGAPSGLEEFLPSERHPGPVPTLLAPPRGTSLPSPPSGS